MRDGIVLEGIGNCNEALMTGESLPVEKRASARLLGGTHLIQGYLVYQVATAAEESALHGIIASVEQKIEAKSHLVRPVDQIIRWLFPSFCSLLWQQLSAVLSSPSKMRAKQSFKQQFCGL